MSDLVECRSDFEYSQRPVAFTWQGKRITVDELLSQVRTPAGYTFRVRSDELGAFELTYDFNTDQWSVEQL